MKIMLVRSKVVQTNFKKQCKRKKECETYFLSHLKRLAKNISRNNWLRKWHVTQDMTQDMCDTIFFNRIAWWFMRVKKVKRHKKRVKINGDGPPRGVTVDKRVFRLGLLQNQTESLTNIICEGLQPFIPFQPKSKPVVGLWSPTVVRSWTLWPALAWPPPFGSKVP